MAAKDPRAWERRQLLDTYKTFGCDSGELDFYPAFTKDEFRALNGWRDIVPGYSKDYISFNTYAA